MKIIRLIVIYFLHMLVFKISCNFSSKNLFKRKYILSLALPVAIPLIYLLEKKFASNYLNKHSELPSYCKFNLFSLFFFNFYFREIPRPTVYEEHALMKVKEIKNCFYELKKTEDSDRFYYHKDFTQSMISNLLNKNLSSKQDCEDYQDIAKKAAINKLRKIFPSRKHNEKIFDISGDPENPFATIKLTHSDTDLLSE